MKPITRRASLKQIALTGAAAMFPGVHSQRVLLAAEPEPQPKPTESEEAAIAEIVRGVMDQHHAPAM